MKQVNKKPSLCKGWWDIGFEGNGGVKSKETRVCNSKGKVVIVLYLAHEHIIFYKRANYDKFSLTITDPCFLAFYTTIALKSYIPPTVS